MGAAWIPSFLFEVKSGQHVNPGYSPSFYTLLKSVYTFRYDEGFCLKTWIKLFSSSGSMGEGNSLILQLSIQKFSVYSDYSRN